MLVEALLQNCGIGIDGLSSLIENLPSRKFCIDVSYNQDIFTSDGGDKIGAQVSLPKNEAKFILMTSIASRPPKYDAFLEKLMHHLIWKPKLEKCKSWDSEMYLELNVMAVEAIEAFHYYRSPLHATLMNCPSHERNKLANIILGLLNSFTYNVEVLCFWVKELDLP